MHTSRLIISWSASCQRPSGTGGHMCARTTRNWCFQYNAFFSGRAPEEEPWRNITGERSASTAQKGLSIPGATETVRSGCASERRSGKLGREGPPFFFWVIALGAVRKLFQGSNTHKCENIHAVRITPGDRSGFLFLTRWANINTPTLCLICARSTWRVTEAV